MGIQEVSEILEEQLLVTEGYILATGHTNNHGYTINGKHFYTTELGIWKVHPEHPLEILATGKTLVRPVDNQKMYPAEVWSHPKIHDFSLIRLIPGIVDNYELEEKEYFKDHEVQDGFTKTDGTKSPLKITAYTKRQVPTDMPDIKIANPILQTHLIHYLWNFLDQGKRIYYSEKEEDDLEGRIELPIEDLREMTIILIRELEKRYDDKFLLEQDRSRYGLK